MSRRALLELSARSLDAPSELCGHLPALFADLEDLGVRAVDVVRLLSLAPPTPGARILDLGCGKGHTTLALAQQFSVHTLGIDATSGFVAHARARARALGFSSRCRFRVDDIRRVVRLARDYDLVLMLGLGDLLGSMPETVNTLLNLTGPGGRIVIDDAILRPGADPTAFPGCFDRRTARALVASANGRVVAELSTETEEMRDWLSDAAQRLSARAETLAQCHPELAQHFLGFAQRQAKELCDPANELQGVLWLIEFAH